MTDKKNKFITTYTNSHPVRVDKYLTHAVKSISRQDIQEEITQGHLKVNNVKVTKPSYLLREHDIVSFIYQKETNDQIRETLQVHYQDDDFLVIEKPSGMVVYRMKQKKDDPSVIDIVRTQFPEIEPVGESYRPGVVHRLDKHTSGLLVIARSKKGYEYMKKLFRERAIQKKYLALVYGHAKRAGSIEIPLAKIGVRGSSRVMVDNKEGRYARSDYKALAFYTQKGSEEHLDEYTLVEVQLHTGRTHQIRVHFDTIGHPVMGDTLYGKPNSQKLKNILDRQFLHASHLEFRKPDGSWLALESKLPRDLQKVLSALTQTN